MPNLTISFTPASPTPALGYRVKYWNVNTPGNIITVSPNPTSSPVVIPGVAAGCYSGSVESACSGGVYSSAVSFTNVCSPSATSSVTSAYGYMEPCIGGTIDDYMGAQVNLNAPVTVDTVFNVDVKYVFPPMTCGSGGSQFTQSFTIEILAGQSSSTFNACTSGAYFSGGANICSACITSCDNPAVNLATFGC